MPETDISQQLESLFAAPLPDCAQRHIVIWHDVEGEFESEFEELASTGMTDVTGNPVAFVHAHDGVMFRTKKRILRDEPATSFLVYEQRAKGDLEGDWLADIACYAAHFQADHSSLLIAELGAVDCIGVREALARFKAFFRSKDRAAKFARYVTRAASKDDVALGVLAVLCGATDAQAAAIICAYARHMTDLLEDASRECELVEKLRKYDALDVMVSLVQKITGYAGDVKDARAFLCHLLVSAASATLPADELSGLESRISPGNAEFCLGIVNEWAACDGTNKGSALYEACRSVERELNLPARFRESETTHLLGCDVFPAVDEAILESLFVSIAQGSDRRQDVKEVLATRTSMKWHDIFRAYFDCLEAACDIQRFYRDHTDSFHLARPTEVWDAYLADWWQMDVAYRRFCGAYQQSLRDSSDVSESAADLSAWIDNIYANWFLRDSNRCWTTAAAPQWAEHGFVEGIARQRDFYAESVEPILGKKCVVVGISDGMRYGVAKELVDTLERETKGSAELSAMQAVFPSETKFGMAALLPNATIAYDEASDTVLVDGLPTTSTADRQAILEAARPKSKAITLTDLLDMKPAQRTEFARDLDLVYVYQNTIDKAGHGDSSGYNVFKACEEAIADMRGLVETAVKHMGASQVLITADHGFLFTHKEFRELDLVSSREFAGNETKVERRFLRTRSDMSSDTLLAMRASMQHDDGWSWWAARDCVRIKAHGSRNYVHGGVSLQELCVPVVKFTNRRSGSKGYVQSTPAEIQLLSSSRRITNSITNIDFFQKEPVGGKVLAAEYDLEFTDSCGNAVSDSRRVCADKTSTSEGDRTLRASFTLKPGIQWDPKATYYLMARDAKTGNVAWREQFSIEVYFAPMDDFGW